MNRDERSKTRLEHEKWHRAASGGTRCLFARLFARVSSSSACIRVSSTLRSRLASGYCTLWSRAINFWARFSSDSDQSRRPVAPAFFSTLAVNSTSFCTLLRMLCSASAVKSILRAGRKYRVRNRFECDRVLGGVLLEFKAVAVRRTSEGSRSIFRRLRAESRDPNRIRKRRRNRRGEIRRPRRPPPRGQTRDKAAFEDGGLAPGDGMNAE